MAEIIAVINFKGGAGKTQTANEALYWLAKKGKRVLALDTDHQANLTKLLSQDTPTAKRKLPEILIAGDYITRNDVSTRIIDKEGHRIDYIASSLAAGRLEKKLRDDLPKEYVLQDALSQIKDYYDYILIDTPPSAELISTCTLIASDSVLIVSQAALFSADGVHKLMPLINTMQNHPRLNPNLKVLGIIITMYEKSNDSEKTMADLREAYGDLVITPVIRKCTKVKESNRRFTAVQTYSPTCTSANDYRCAFDKIFGSKLGDK